MYTLIDKGTLDGTTIASRKSLDGLGFFDLSKVIGAKGDTVNYISSFGAVGAKSPNTSKSSNRAPTLAIQRIGSRSFVSIASDLWQSYMYYNTYPNQAASIRSSLGNVAASMLGFCKMVCAEKKSLLKTGFTLGKTYTYNCTILDGVRADAVRNMEVDSSVMMIIFQTFKAMVYDVQRKNIQITTSSFIWGALKKTFSIATSGAYSQNWGHYAGLYKKLLSTGEYGKKIPQDKFAATLNLNLISQMETLRGGKLSDAFNGFVPALVGGGTATTKLAPSEDDGSSQPEVDEPQPEEASIFSTAFVVTVGGVAISTAAALVWYFKFYKPRQKAEGTIFADEAANI
jgi:hypothetical protein